MSILSKGKPNRSLAAKSSARLAAAQLLYQTQVTKRKPNAEKLAAEYLDFYEENQNAKKEAHLPEVKPDQSYLKKLLGGVIEHAPRLEPLVENVLAKDWKKERISPLMLAILRLAAFEMAEGKLAPAIVVDEYATLAHLFFSDQETGFIHAALHALAKELRASPLSGTSTSS